MKRMITDYYQKFYFHLFERRRLMRADEYQLARRISAWKNKVIRSWDNIEVISINIPDSSAKPLLLGEKFIAEVELNLHNLTESDIGLEVLFGQKVFDEVKEIMFIEEMYFAEKKKGTVVYRCEIPVSRAGVYDYSIRIFPKSELLVHRQDFTLVKWI
jgi:glycogen phosphorylase/synthase